jgi:hypothetical protein
MVPARSGRARWNPIRQNRRTTWTTLRQQNLVEVGEQDREPYVRYAPNAVVREGRIYLTLIGRIATDFPTFYEGRSTPLRPMQSREPNLQERRLANAFQDKHG